MMAMDMKKKENLMPFAPLNLPSSPLMLSSALSPKSLNRYDTFRECGGIKDFIASLCSSVSLLSSVQTETSPHHGRDHHVMLMARKTFTSTHLQMLQAGRASSTTLSLISSPSFVLIARGYDCPLPRTESPNGSDRDW